MRERDTGLMSTVEHSPSASQPGGSWGASEGRSQHRRPLRQAQGGGRYSPVRASALQNSGGALRVVWLQLHGAVTPTPCKSPELCVQLSGFRVFTVLYGHHNFRLFPSPPPPKKKLYSLAITHSPPIPSPTPALGNQLLIFFLGPACSGHYEIKGIT